MDAVYRPFLLPRAGAPADTDTVAVRFGTSSPPSFEGRVILESSANWSILARGEERAVVYRLPSETEPAWIARFRRGAAEVSVACSPSLVETVGGTAALPSGLFCYPLDQILTMYLLGGRGLILHAAGAIVTGRGVAFAGVSGAGKTTLAGLASGRPGWVPLSDDRLVVRTDGEVPRLWGTPWSGEGQVAEHRAGDLASLLFLEQAEAEEIRPLSPSEALPRLLQTASLPWHDAEHLGTGFAACDRLLRTIPAAALRFRPNVGAIEAVERLLGGADPSR